MQVSMPQNNQIAAQTNAVNRGKWQHRKKKNPGLKNVR